MTSIHSGSCLCGEARFEIAGDFERFFLCHCSRCRKGTGSAHGANLFSTQAKLTWLSGEDKVRTFKVAETRHQKAFCSECGSALPYVAGNGAFVVTPAGSLDGEPGISTNGHIFFADRAGWYEQLSGAARSDGFPGV